MKIDITSRGQQQAEHAGRMLQGWRERNGLSRYAVHQATGLRVETIGKIEDGKGTIASFFTYLTAAKLMDTPRDFGTLKRAIFE